MPERAIEVRQITHRYVEDPVLRDVSFSVGEGSLFGLLGPNGSGKTTLFRILSTILLPSEGVARVQGHDTSSQPRQVRRLLGTVFQEPALDEELTVLENLRFHGALYNVTGNALRTRLDSLLSVFNLHSRADSKVKTLSGGLRRQTDLIRGLLHRPAVLLLDEPTVGLDPAARRAFWQALSRLRRTERTTMLVATHLMEEAESCDRVVIMDEGRVVALGTPNALREALGGETLWIETDDPSDLAERIRMQFGADAQVIGGRVQVSHDDVPALLNALYDALAPRIDSATVRKPTLEDVFLVRTGASLHTPASPAGELQP